MDVGALRTRLLKEQQGLKERLQRNSRQMREGPIPRTPDPADEADARLNQHIGIGLAQQDGNRLRQISVALAKLSAGTYGNCEKCGDSISQARLNAVPWAQFCITCQEGLDQNKQRGRSEAFDVSLDPEF